MRDAPAGHFPDRPTFGAAGGKTGALYIPAGGSIGWREDSGSSLFFLYKGGAFWYNTGGQSASTALFSRGRMTRWREYRKFGGCPPAQPSARGWSKTPGNRKTKIHPWDRKSKTVNCASAYSLVFAVRKPGRQLFRTPEDPVRKRCIFLA